MIIVDLSQVILSNLFQSSRDGLTFEEEVIRAMVLTSLRGYKTKFSDEFGEMVIAADGPSFWRKAVFPYYKANRKRDRAESTIDWKKIFTILNNVREEIRDNFPYRVVRAEGAEADDVIGVLVSENSLESINNNNRILIISGDKDFIQLQKYPNVKQYDPVKKKHIVHNDPRSFLREHIIRGDAGDGVPNILSADDTFVLSNRSKAVTAKRLATYMAADPDDEEVLRNFKRNEMLIDLSKIPDTVREAVLTSYEAESGKGKSKILPYLARNKLSLLLNVANDF